MNCRHILLAAAATGLLFSHDCRAFAQDAAAAAKPLPFVSPLFGDDMVLQRDKADAIWGWSEPGDNVRVQIGDNNATGVAQADRRWQVKIKPPAPGGPYTVKITGRETVELHNVMVGDVWLCGGQSNMGLPLRATLNGADEVKAANYPEIRFFDVFGHSAYNHTGVIAGSWKVVSPQTAAPGFGGRVLLCARGPEGNPRSHWPGGGCRRRNAGGGLDQRRRPSSASKTSMFR